MITNAEKLAIIKKRLEVYREFIKKVGEKHPEVYVLAGDCMELVKMCEEAMPKDEIQA